MTSTLTNGQALRDLAGRLARAGIDTAQLDARLLVEAATGQTREAMFLAPDRQLDMDQRARLEDAAARRLAREPVSRILGQRSFYGRAFEISADTLDPRPETETLVDLAWQIASDEGWPTQPIRILDIGTGTGCLLLTLLAQLPLATGVGTDISSGALAVAERNAVRLGLAARCDWRRADIASGVDGLFDLVVSNPPYIPSRDIAALEAEVRLYDPPVALDGGVDGLAIYRRLLPETSRLAQRGWACVEVGAGQAGAVVGLVRTWFGDLQLPVMRTAKDLGGHTRCVAWKPRF